MIKKNFANLFIVQFVVIATAWMYPKLAKPAPKISNSLNNSRIRYRQTYLFLNKKYRDFIFQYTKNGKEVDAINSPQTTAKIAFVQPQLPPPTKEKKNFYKSILIDTKPRVSIIAIPIIEQIFPIKDKPPENTIVDNPPKDKQEPKKHIGKIIFKDGWTLTITNTNKQNINNYIHTMNHNSKMVVQEWNDFDAKTSTKPTRYISLRKPEY